MLPLRLHMENFGSFRSPATVDFHDVDYFVLVGPTGAGKSTVIDAICFALYGTVPRWGQKNVVSMALAPSATSGKVALVFEVSGRRYGIVRVLARSARGVVSTKEARLEELDPNVDPSADLADMLGAAVRPLAEGDRVTAETQRITGLEYRFFTQCVVLPQGRFAEFLHSAPRERQDLLVQLLDAEVYEQIRRRAGETESVAKAAASSAQDQLAALSDAGEETERAAEQRLAALRALTGEVRTVIDRLRKADAEVAEHESRTGEARQAIGTLTAVVMPQRVPTLAEELRAAEEDAARLAAEADEHAAQRDQAEEELAALGDKSELRDARSAHLERQRLTEELAELDLEAVRQVVAQAEAANEQAAEDLAKAVQALQRSRDAHAAVDLARRLAVGEPCPVCLRELAELPQHAAPAELEVAERAVHAYERRLDGHRAAQRKAERELAGVERELTRLRADLDRQTAHISAHPDLAAVRQRLARIEAAAKAAQRARQQARAAGRDHQDALQRAAAVRREVDKAWDELTQARDTVVAFGAPQLAKNDLHEAWAALLGWRDQEVARRKESGAALQNALSQARAVRDQEVATLRTLLETNDLPRPRVPDPDAVSAVVTGETARAEDRLERIREDRRRSARLTEQIRAHEQTARVAHELELRLRANNFEKWLCSEALALLVTVASETLRELSDGQFELVLAPKTGDIEVVDYAEAGLRRSVRTLSGGETFQASLALALALSDQIAGLTAGTARSLDSIFLDEGFGTLDPATLDTVATTLERLAVGGERMVGIVTHVPALAERVPVRFEITRDGAGSHLEKKAT
jgi:DNA repair protein SbcC/Rad50